ncbi:MAG: GntR family transcriptional regulator [Bacillota bacterium]|nr:MAG: GntR family transcriptional regulator [Bacillota bacterium]
MTAGGKVVAYSLQDKVYSELRKSILQRKVESGHHFTEKEVAARFGVSRTPARAALNRLETEGLLKRDGQALVVARLTPEDVRNLLIVRIALDGVAARLAVEHITDSEVEELDHLCTLMEETIAEHPRESADNDRKFHEAIAQASRNPYLSLFLRQNFDNLHAFRLFSYSSPGMTERTIIDHRSIYQAISHRRADEAEARSREHVENVLKTIVDALQGQAIQW